MSSGQRLALASTLVIAASGASFAAQPDARILHHEAIGIAARKVGAVERVSFDAFGKRFELALQPNERVRPASADVTGIEPLRGEVVGAPGSWARLTRSADGRWQGMVSDGHELYAIDAAGDIQAMVVQPLAKTGPSPVMYRLADLIVNLGPGFCEALPVGESTTGLEVYKSLSSEMQPQASSVPLSKQLAIGVIGDYEFASLFNAPTMTPSQVVVARMNIVDGIFSDQLGITIDVPTITIFTTANDPFTQYEAKDLLDEVRRYRRSTPDQSSRGLTHLMTGRDLNGSTVGVAYLGSVCGGEYAASLSEGTGRGAIAALIAAHEMGHNFNAPHDGEGACAAEGSTYLMAPRLNGSSEFSACSLKQMRPTISTARCLQPYSPPDPRLELTSTSIQATVNTVFNLRFTVHSGGSASSKEVTATAALPAGLTASSTAGGACTAGAGTVSCSLGTIESGDLRVVDLGLKAASAGSFPVELTVSASQDGNSSNNTGRVDVVVTDEPTVPPAPQTTAGGGGGAVAYEMLSVLATLSLLRALSCRRSRRRASDNPATRPALVTRPPESPPRPGNRPAW